MRSFLDAILAFIGAESLTDLEFEGIDLDAAVYNQDSYEAVLGLLNDREEVSSKTTQLQYFFAAKGVDLNGTTVAPTPKSNIFLGQGLTDTLRLSTSGAIAGATGPAGEDGIQGPQGIPGNVAVYDEPITESGAIPASRPYTVVNSPTPIALSLPNISEVDDDGDSLVFVVVNAGTDDVTVSVTSPDLLMGLTDPRVIAAGSAVSFFPTALGWFII